MEQFPCLKLARDAGKTGGTLPAVLNGANEIAVESFLGKRIKFTDLPIVISEVLSRHQSITSPTLDDVLEADRWARQEVNYLIDRRLKS